MRKRLLAPIALSVALAACSGAAEPPAVPPSDVSAFPAVAEAGYASTTVTGVYPMGLAETRAWIADGNKIVAEMEPTENIAKPSDIVYLTGDWPEPGATRRVEMTDGHFALERVLSNTADTFEYQIWGLTSAAGRNVDHVHGIQAFDALDDGTTRLTWTYKVKPNAGFKRPFVQRFVDKDVTPFLSQALENTVTLANAQKTAS